MDWQEMQTHVGSGKLVKIILDYEDNASVVGYLESLDESGEAQMLVDGLRHHCWPALDLEPLED